MKNYDIIIRNYGIVLQYNSDKIYKATFGA